MVLILLIIVGTAAPLAARSGQGVVIGVATSLTSLEGRESLMAARLAVEKQFSDRAIAAQTMALYKSLLQ